MKSISIFLEEAHKISLLRNTERNLNEVLSLLKNKKIQEAEKLIKETLQLQKEN